MARLIIEPEAEADITDAHDWYERERPGLGNDFELCVEAGLQTVLQRPKSFAKIHKNVRRVLINRFPHAIFFLEQQGMIIVIAVFHVRRNPKSWQNRAK